MPLRSWWTNYRWRFAPWIAGRVAADKTIRRSNPTDEDPQFRSHLTHQLFSLCAELHRTLPVTRSSERRISGEEFTRAQEALRGTFGFSLDRSASSLNEGGEGVFVTGGTIKKDQLAAIYPGTVYFPGEPALLVSLGNSFVFRCANGCLIDGNDRRLSKFIYRSCCYRDRRGPFLTSDMTWLTSRPANPLAIGQYVNNETADNPANVRYVELELDAKNVHPTLRRFVPNIEDAPDVVNKKCAELADLMRNSRCTLVYTGAGISTAASIPDYRGPNGVWTLAEQGKRTFECRDPVHSSPTTSHMALREMYKRGLVRHILSQNCDGLHLRSGIPQKSLSEIHGNMHIEVCREGCSTLRQYVRPFDVTKKSQFRRHKTGRYCDHCHTELDDTIVHFGEVGRVQWPLNWAGTTDILDESSCDVLLCLGTSLAVLKQYSFLWPKGEAKKRAKIVIVNLQWTPKDRFATIKIHAKCDDVLTKVMQLLGATIPEYCRSCDPILNTKRSARSGELMSRITECTCCGRGPSRRSSYAPPSPDVASPATDLVTPGWWTVGISRSLKRSLLTSTTSGQASRRKSRGKRSKASKNRSQRKESSDTNDVDDECVVNDDVIALVEWMVSSVS